MDREDVKSLFMKIKLVHNNFEVTSENLDLWAYLFKDADKLKVSRRLNKYLLESSYPPKPADLYAKKVVKDETLLEIEERKKVIAKEGAIPEHLKNKMNKLINDLTEKMSKNDD